MIRIERPLVFLDAEGTGVNTEEDRIVELTIARLDLANTYFYEGADGPNVDIRSRLINPTVPIPPEATAVHGITDEDVAGEPTFAQIATSLLEHLTGVDFGGFNIVGYDLPLLEAEFARCGLEFDWQQQFCVDGYAILCQQEPRDLASVYRRMFGEELEGAHRSEADVAAAMRVAFGQAELFELGTPEKLDAGGRREDAADRQGKILITEDLELVFGFGKHYGKPLRSQVGYLRWMLEQDFPSDTCAIVSEIVATHDAAKQQQQELP